MKIRHAMLSVLLLGAMFFAVSCGKPSRRHFNTYVDLNGDGKPEIIFWKGKKHWTYRDYDLMAKFSDETSKAEPRLIQRFRNRPDQISFVCVDDDDNLDMIFSVYGKKHWTYRDYDTYLLKNDGLGNFGSPKLINRQNK